MRKGFNAPFQLSYQGPAGHSSTGYVHRPVVFMAADFCHQLVGQFGHPLDSQPLFFVAALTSRYKLDKKINALELQRLQKIILHFPSYHYLGHIITVYISTVYNYSIVNNEKCKTVFCQSVEWI